MSLHPASMTKIVGLLFLATPESEFVREEQGTLR